MPIHEKLRELRIDADKTQEEIANVLKTDRSYYGKYERNVRPITVDHLETLCKYYGVSADYILGLPKNLKWPR